MYAPQGFLIYEGLWKEDKPHGLGIMYYKNGFKSFEGEFENGKKIGKGTEFD